jgi:rare lipoprotein A
MIKLVFAGIIAAGGITTARAQDAIGGIGPQPPQLSAAVGQLGTVRAMRKVARLTPSVPAQYASVGSGYGRLVTASWYGGGEKLSAHTANGERFRSGGLTAAHKTLPFGTRVRVTNPRTGASAVIRINDRGPFVAGRSLDLARGAAQAIGLRSTQPIRMEVL